MNILKQLGIILTFGFAGELAARYSPLSLPSAVSGMLLILLALGIKVLKPDHIGQTADFLSANLSFFLLPAVVNIIKSFAYIQPALFKLFVICLITTFATFASTYTVVRLTQTLIKKVKRI